MGSGVASLERCFADTSRSMRNTQGFRLWANFNVVAKIHVNTLVEARKSLGIDPNKIDPAVA